MSLQSAKGKTVHEIHPHNLHTLKPGTCPWGALTNEPTRPRFHAARKALRRLGGVYQHEVRAWSLPVTDDAVDALTRMYDRTTLALDATDAGEAITPEMFDRYTKDA